MKNNTVKTKPVQFFSAERLARDRDLPKEQIVEFIENFQALVAGDEGKRKLISLRVPEKLLKSFRAKSAQIGVAYQTQIINLMRAWISGDRKQR